VLPPWLGEGPGTEIFAQDHAPEHVNESACVDTEDDHVQPPGDLAVPGEDASPEDPAGCHDDLGESVAEVEVAEPLREHPIFVEQNREHPNQRADQEDTHGSIKRQEGEVVEPTDRFGVALGSQRPDDQRDAEQQQPGNRTERVHDQV